jgi:hypothetical protein
MRGETGSTMPTIGMIMGTTMGTIMGTTMETVMGTTMGTTMVTIMGTERIENLVSLRSSKAGTHLPDHRRPNEIPDAIRLIRLDRITVIHHMIVRPELAGV